MINQIQSDENRNDVGSREFKSDVRKPKELWLSSMSLIKNSIVDDSKL